MAGNPEPREIFTFRVEGLPLECDHAKTKALVGAAVGLKASGSDMAVHSLAASALRGGEKTATITSEALARSLQQQPAPKSRRWTFTVPPAFLPRAAHSDDTPSQVNREIFIDTHFDGFTPLHSFDDKVEHRLE
jgi:hypothetical protein